MKTYENKERGDFGEQLACDYLVGKGFEIIARNYRKRCGEIDIIAKNADFLVFVEVKARKKNSLIRGVEAVDYKKQCKIVKTAEMFLNEYVCEQQVRLDVIDIIIDDLSEPPKTIITHYEDAFDASGKSNFYMNV